MFQDLDARGDLRRTGIPWLPSAPVDWPIVRVKRLLREAKQVVGPAWADTDLLALTKQGVVPRDINNLEGKVPGSFEGYQVLEPSDLVFCLFDIDETPRTVGLATTRGMITSAYTRFQVTGGSLPRYLELLFASLDDRKLLRPLYTGLRKSIRTPDLLAISIPLPPLDEQRTIVRYLANAHLRINRAIASKRRLIALHDEQKKAIIRNVVTRGVRADVRLVDSGIPWLGLVPDHWDLLAARYLFRPVTRPIEDPALPQLSLTRAAGLVKSGIDGSNTKAAEGADNLQECRRGDFVLNKYRAHLGLFRWCREPGLVTRNYTVLASTDRVYRDYFEYLFLEPSFADGLRVNARGVGDGMSPLYTATLMSMKIPVPPLSEQEAVVRQLREQTAIVDSAIALARREIALFEEFRTRLTSDVVTGVVDVRRTAAGLPDRDLDDALAEIESTLADEAGDEEDE